MALPAVAVVLRALSSIDSILSIGKEVYEWATGDDEPEKKEPVPAPVKKVRKKRDNTKFTQYQYDFIITAHEKWMERNIERMPGQPRITQTELACEINEVMGTDKSTRALATIWDEKVDYDQLPSGEPYFDY